MQPISLRLTPEMDDRLKAIAEKLRIPKQRLAQIAVEAAIEAAEEHGALVLPVKFTRREPAGLQPTKIPAVNPATISYKLTPANPALNDADRPAPLAATKHHGNLTRAKKAKEKPPEASRE